MPEPKSPAWYAKPFTLSFPVGILAVLATVLGTGGVIGAASAGGVGIVTRDADLSAVEATLTTAMDAKVHASAEQLRDEADSAHAASDLLSSQRYDEILRRLDRIERTLDR